MSRMEGICSFYATLHQCVQAGEPDYQASRDNLMKCKPESTFEVILPKNFAAASVVWSTLHGGEMAVDALEHFSTFLDERCIKPFDFRIKILLVIRDYVATRHLQHVIKKLKKNLTNRKILHMLVCLIPISHLYLVLEEILELFEYKFKNSDSFIATKEAIQNYKATVCSQHEDGVRLQDTSGKYCRLLICSDNNRPSIAVKTSSSAIDKNKDLAEIFLFITEYINIPEHVLSIFERISSSNSTC